MWLKWELLKDSEIKQEVYRIEETQHKEMILPGQEEAEQTWWKPSLFFL